MKIYVVGLGPGKEDLLSPMAKEAILKSSVIVTYSGYLPLFESLTKGKKIIVSPMRQEVQRCTLAVENALKGETVAVACSGDAGIYGLAGLIFELCEKHPEIEVEVVPGITAASSVAAILGAPLTHDFAVISLSDLLTPWEKIEKRLLLAAEADFVICLYNPRSKKRDKHLEEACKLMLKHKSPETACGYVQNAGRDGEKKVLCTLQELLNNHQEVDMFTTLIIGNSQTFIGHNALITPRGYKIEKA